MTHDDRIRMELGGYVLGGLDHDEVAAVEAHLARCEACREELAELAPLPDLLALAATDQPRAPADLRHRVLDRPGRRGRRSAVALLVAAAAAIGVLAGAGASIVLDRPPPPDAVVALRSPGPATVAGAAELEQVDAGVVVDLELTGVRPAEEGYYHAWLEADGWRASAGTFVGPPDGAVRAQLLCGGRLEDYHRLTVTWHGADGGDEVVAAQADLTTDGPVALRAGG